MLNPASPSDPATVTALAAIFARGGSKGIPDKNLQTINGIPIIAMAIQTARQCGRIGRVVVSTDSPGIAEVAVQAGAEVPFLRPAELATDGSVEFDAWKHLMSHIDDEGNPPTDLFVSVPTVCPLRRSEDVNRVIDAFLASGADLAMTITRFRENPYYLACHQDEDGFINRAFTHVPLANRQQAKPVWKLVAGAYVTTPDYVRRSSALFDGKVLGVALSETRSIDIDDPLDLAFARFLAAQQEPVRSELGQ